jgi:ABC-type Na+ efflux pump permease subunit
VNSGKIDLIIHAKNQYNLSGHKTGTRIYAEAKKLSEDLHVNVDKTTLVKSDQQAITENKIAVKVSNKNVDSSKVTKRSSMFLWFGLLALMLIFLYFYIKKQY